MIFKNSTIGLILFLVEIDSQGLQVAVLNCTLNTALGKVHCGDRVKAENLGIWVLVPQGR